MPSARSNKKPLTRILKNRGGLVLAPGKDDGVKILSCRPKGNLLVSVMRNDLFADTYGEGDRGDPNAVWMLSAVPACPACRRSARTRARRRCLQEERRQGRGASRRPLAASSVVSTRTRA